MGGTAGSTPRRGSGVWDFSLKGTQQWKGFAWESGHCHSVAEWRTFWSKGGFGEGDRQAELLQEPGCEVVVGMERQRCLSITPRLQDSQDCG